jgi:hypothetical protein
MAWLGAQRPYRQHRYSRSPGRSPSARGGAGDSQRRARRAGSMSDVVAARSRARGVGVQPGPATDAPVRFLVDRVGSGRSDLPTWSKERHSCLERAQPRHMTRSARPRVRFHRTQQPRRTASFGAVIVATVVLAAVLFRDSAWPGVTAGRVPAGPVACRGRGRGRGRRRQSRAGRGSGSSRWHVLAARLAVGRGAAGRRGCRHGRR